MRSALWACLLAVAAAQTAPAQLPTFRAGVDVVYVDVSVLDGKRKPVRGLTAADFVVKEDGKVRPVVAFSPVVLPARVDIPNSPVRQVAADVVTNERSREGRLVVILMDQSIPIGQPTIAARKVAAAAIEQLAPGDLAAITFGSAFAFNGTVQGFTSDRARLLAAINSPFLGRTNAPFMSASGGLVDGNQDSLGLETTCHCGLCLLETVTRIATAMQDSTSRRKSLVLIGTGEGVALIREPAGIGRNMCPTPDAARTRMLNALRDANLTLHAFDPTGLETLAPGFGVGRGGGGGPMSVAGTRERQNVLHTLAEQTGGRAITSTNDPAFHVPEVFQESEAYYVLGFERGSLPADGRLHKIDVQVNRRGVKVRTRRGYVADRAAAPGAPPSDRGDAGRLITSALPENGLPLTVAVAPFAAANGSDTELAVVIGVRQSAGASSAPQRVQVVGAAFSPTGRRVAEYRRQVSVQPPAASGGEFEYDIVSRLSLKSGHYEIRVGVQPDNDAGGSIYVDVDVPTFSPERLALSGVVLSTTAGSEPTARRQFQSTDHVAAIVRTYQAASSAAAPAQLIARIVDSEGRLVAEERVTPAVEDRFDLPLSRLSAGEYLLTISAAAGVHTARRDVQFRVK